MVIWRQPVMGMLRCGLELELVRDARRLGGTDEADAVAEESRILREIQQYGEYLGAWVIAIAKRDASAEPMPILDSAEAGAFREVYSAAREWLLEHPERRLSAYEDYDTFRERFEGIPHSQLMRAYQVAYSKQWLRELSDWFALQGYSDEIEARTARPLPRKS